MFGDRELFSTFEVLMKSCLNFISSYAVILQISTTSSHVRNSLRFQKSVFRTPSKILRCIIFQCRENIFQIQINMSDKFFSHRTDQVRRMNFLQTRQKKNSLRKSFMLILNIRLICGKIFNVAVNLCLNYHLCYILNSIIIMNTYQPISFNSNNSLKMIQ